MLIKYLLNKISNIKQISKTDTFDSVTLQTNASSDSVTLPSTPLAEAYYTITNNSSNPLKVFPTSEIIQIGSTKTFKYRKASLPNKRNKPYFQFLKNKDEDEKAVAKDDDWEIIEDIMKMNKN